SLCSSIAPSLRPRWHFATSGVEPARRDTPCSRADLLACPGKPGKFRQTAESSEGGRQSPSRLGSVAREAAMPSGIAAVEQEKQVFSPRSADERRHGVVDIPLCLENRP